MKVAEAANRRAKIWEGQQIRTKPAQRPGAAQRPDVTPQTLLQEAAALFLGKQRERCRRETIESNSGHVDRLVEFFGNIPLGRFTAAHFEHYQSVRGATCAASTVNHELNTLSRILRKADLWLGIKRNYAPLEDMEWERPRIFDAEEQTKIFRALQTNPSLALANIALTITRNTTASGCELRGLRISSLELDADPPRVHIPPDSVKNSTRPRTIPLNADAVRACKLAIERAKKMGSLCPEDYLFPFRVDRATWARNGPRIRAGYANSWLSCAL